MAALDTNVVVRMITFDDKRQAQAAEDLLTSEPCTVAASVLMECEWVLRDSYGFDPSAIAAAMRGLLALKNIAVRDPALVQQTLRAYEAGMDFADALHAMQRAEDETFATFDRKLTRKAAQAGIRGIDLLKS